MRDWPPIDDPRVLAWLALDHDAWRVALEERIRQFGPRRYDAAALRHALAYPWERPAGSYVLRDGVVAALEDMGADARRATVTAFARDRSPLVAFGANGAPARLRERFAAFEDPQDRDVLVLVGELRGVDVCAQASPSAFGTVPAVVVASPGTAVRASLLWLTPRQLAVLTLAELGYRFGRLDRATFTMDEADVAVDDVFAYVSRIGALRLDDGPVALAAVPATGRSLPAMSQEEVLDALAVRLIGPSARAPDVVRACIDDMPALIDRVAALTWPTAVRLPDDDWTPYPLA